MLEIASQMILCLLLAALLGFILGYLFCKMTCGDDSCETESSHSSKTEITETGDTVTSKEYIDEGVDEGIAPQFLSVPRGGEKDNLTRIKGIGVKIEEALNGAGIFHFDQIANWTEENVKWVDANIAFPGRVKREEWITQAKHLAEGRETEFSKRVDAGEVATSKKS
ncbi:MAG: hypothetical protein DSZ10_03035 [Sulfurovum sp.]|nr:MAG: hypothetical protein DSZ10_03035 [Sulfurovum sp.]